MRKLFFFLKKVTKKEAKYDNMKAVFPQSSDMPTVDVLLLTDVDTEEVRPQHTLGGRGDVQGGHLYQQC